MTANSQQSLQEQEKQKKYMLNKPLSVQHLCLSPRWKKQMISTQLSKSSFQTNNMIDSDYLRTPTTPKFHEMLQFPQTPRHIYRYDHESINTPKDRFFQNQMIMQVPRTSSFEAYKQHFFSMYRFSMSPRPNEETTKVKNSRNDVEEEEEEEKLKLDGFIDRLNKVDMESSEFLNMLPDREEAIKLIGYLKERVQDPHVKTIWDVLKNLPTNLDVQVDIDRIGLISTVKERGLYSVGSMSPKKVERFKVRTLDLGGAVVKDGGIVKK